MGDKKVSNIKRMGVKSIHYNKNNIIIEDSFSNKNEIIYDAEYDDVNELKNLKKLTKNSNNKNTVEFKDVLNDSGFELSKKVNNEDLISKINSIKSKSYIQNILNITDENNIEIQIYQNYEDIRKLITIVCGHIFYSINSIVSIDFKGIDNLKFDKIGTISVKTEFEKYRSKTNEDDELKVLIESMKKVFKNFGIGLNSFSKRKNKNSNSGEDERRDNILIYDYLRMFSAIRNFALHGSLTNEAIACLDSLSKIAQKDLMSFGRTFVKNNLKYKNILSSVYGNVFYEFFDYSVYASMKNLGVSIEKIRKYVMEGVGENSRVSSQNMAEYLNKLKVVLGFAIFKKIKEENVQNIIQLLKEAKNEDEKEEIYKKIATRFLRNEQKLIQNIEYSVSKNLGKVFGDFGNINLDSKMNEVGLICENGFLNMLYVFTKFLTKQEANNFFAKLITKVESIKNLIELTKVFGIKLNIENFKSFENIISINSNFEKLQKQLEILKNLRSNKQNDQNDIQKEHPNYNKVLNCFETNSYTYDKLAKEIEIASKTKKNEKPLKQFLRNSIINSKSYKYITSVTDTKICPKIMKQRELVSFAIDSILGVNSKEKSPSDEVVVSKDKEPMLKYIKTIWCDYMRSEYSDRMRFSYAALCDLKGVVSELTFEKISESVFTNSRNNYLALVKLYFNVCYLVVKNLTTQNTSYLIAFEDLEQHNRLISNSKVDCSVVEHFINNTQKQNTRSYKQLFVLLESDYIKDYYKKQEYFNLIKDYRNCVTHCFLLSDLSLFDTEIKNITSYFALYQILIQRWLKTSKKEKLDFVWGKKFDEFFSLDKNKSYSTRFTIALNFPFAYNMARFNNLTIEKYALKNKR